MSHRGSDLFNNIVPIVFPLGSGVVFLIRPDIPIKWAKAAHPQLDENSPNTIKTVRLMAAGFILLGLLMALGILDKAFR